MKNKYVWLSILGHLIILLSISCMITKLPQQPFSQPHIILQTYTYPIKPTLSIKKTLSKTSILKHTAIKKMQTTSRIQSFIIKSTESTYSPLLKLLHDLIAAKQIYPESALELNQSGTVKIGFMLYPNGMMENINMLKSSQISDLDEAALIAVRAISPVKNANVYIKQAEYLTVDVVFAMAEEL